MLAPQVPPPALDPSLIDTHRRLEELFVASGRRGPTGKVLQVLGLGEALQDHLENTRGWDTASDERVFLALSRLSDQNFDEIAQELKAIVQDKDRAGSRPETVT